jgi:hypothetical protein
MGSAFVSIQPVVPGLAFSTWITLAAASLA